jgi:hypothetical protein
MNDGERGAIIGMVMGDGCIRIRKRYEEYRKDQAQALFQCSHSVKQLPYAQFKAGKLNLILGGKAKMSFYDVKLAGHDKVYKMCRFVKANKYFQHLRDWLYVDGKKAITQRMLDWLSLEGLAYLYLDDGCADWWKREDGSVTSVQVSIAICRPVHECDMFLGWLEQKLGIRGKLGIVNNNNYVRLRTEEAKKLFAAVGPYVPSSMLYKVNPTYMPHEHQPPGKLRVKI